MAGRVLITAYIIQNLSATILRKILDDAVTCAGQFGLRNGATELIVSQICFSIGEERSNIDEKGKLLMCNACGIRYRRKNVFHGRPNRIYFQPKAIEADLAMRLPNYRTEDLLCSNMRSNRMKIEYLLNN